MVDNNNLNQKPKITKPKDKNPPIPLQVEQAPELASKANINKNTVTVSDKNLPIKPVKKETKAKAKEFLDTGPVEKKNNFKKVGKILGVTISSLFVLAAIYAGYQYFVNLSPAEVSEEKIRRVREISEREIDEDPTSLDALEKRFNDFGGQVEIMENNANFESKLNLGRKDF